MKLTFIEPHPGRRWPKLCMAKPGDLVQMCDPDSGEPAGGLFLVTLPPHPAYTGGKSAGLYTFPGPVYLTRLSRSEASVAYTIRVGEEGTHLSHRCRIIDGALAELRTKLAKGD